MPTGLITTIVVGAVVGWLASIVTRTNDQVGCLWNVAIAIIGGVLGHWIAARVFDFSIRDGLVAIGLLGGLLGAIILLFLLRLVGILHRDR